jgi:hypothetical protein
MQSVLDFGLYRAIAVGMILLGLLLIGASSMTGVGALWPLGALVLIGAMLFITFADFHRPVAYAGRVFKGSPPVGWAHRDRRTTRGD